MLVEHAMMVEEAGVEGSAPASITTSRARLLIVRAGMTAPQLIRSGRAPWPCSLASMALTTGTERSRASFFAKAPPAFVKGVLTPDASQMSDLADLWGLRVAGLAIGFPRSLRHRLLTTLSG